MTIFGVSLTVFPDYFAMDPEKSLIQNIVTFNGTPCNLHLYRSAVRDVEILLDPFSLKHYLVQEFELSDMFT